MAATYKDNGGSVNGSNKVFTYDFPVLQTEDIKVALNGVTQATTKYTPSLSPANIEFNNTSVDSSVQESTGAPKSGVTVRVYRETTVGKASGDEDPKAVFAAGSSIRAGDLNANAEQALFGIHELQDKLILAEDINIGAITSAKILDDTIVNADVNTSAAIAGTKISPNFGSQAVVTTGTLAAGATTVTGNIAVSGTVDGRDVATDGSKLDGVETGATADQTDAQIRTAVEAASDSNVFTDADHSKLNAIEANATADQTNAEIRAAVEAASDSNVFTDADHTKLNAIEASADVTDATNVNAAGAVMNSDLDVKGELLVGDGSGDPSALSVGTNDYVLTADSSAATGVAWKVAPASMTIQDEGSALSTSATTLNFVGSGVVASGTGASKTITISGGGGGGAVTTDYQYLELKAHNNASGAFSAGAADYELVTKGTNTAVTPAQASALLINIAGVLQEPNTGTSIGSNDGFCIDGSSIHFGANLSAHPDYIVWMKGSGEVSALANDSVTTAKIASSQVTNAKIADDTIAEAKLDIHNAPSGTDKYLKYTSNGMEWATATGGVSDIVDDTSPQLGGALDVQAQEINTSTTNGNIKLTPNGTGVVEVKGNTNPGTIQLNCENNSHGVKIKGPAHSAAASYTLTLPNDDGSANQVLKTDGSGNLSWVAQTTDTNTQLTTEQVEDIVGGMLDGTETGISVSYDDTDGNIDFVVGTLNQDTTGTAAIATTVTCTDESSDTTCAVLFATGFAGNNPVKTGSNLTFNSNTGALGATSFTGDGSALTNVPAPSFEIFEHANALSANKTIGTNNNALVAGPFSTGSYTLTIPSGSVFTVV